MISLIEINEKMGALQRLSTIDLDKAMSGMCELILELMKSDSFYIVSRSEVSTEDLAKKTFMPYIAPVSQTETLQFLRLFSHREAAERFLSSLPETHAICEISTFESVLLAKYWFLLGVDGYMLNDGDAWTTMRFQQFLSLFFTQILHDSERDNAEYKKIASFCRAYCRSPETLCHVQKKQGKGMAVYVFDEQPSELSSSIPWAEILSDLTRDTQKMTVDVNLEGSFQVSTDNFLGVVDEINSIYDSLTKDGLQPLHNGFELSYDGQYDFYSVNPNLALAKDIVFEKHQDDVEEGNGEKVPFDTKTIKDKIFSNIPKIRFPKRSINPKLISKKILGLCAAAVVFLIIVICMFDMGRSQFILADFSEKLSCHDYAGAVLIYQKHEENKMFADKAAKEIEKEMDAIVSDYISDKRTESEARDALSALLSMTFFQEPIASAQETIDKISVSKRAYQTGKKATQVIVRLEQWMNVLPEDLNNWKSVQDDIKSNSGIYLQSSLNTVDSLIQSNCLQQAAEALEILKYWYPTEHSVQSKYDKLTTMSTALPTDTHISEVLKEQNKESPPIKISSVSVTYPDFNNAVDLYINWSNTSEKTIQEIDFYVSPTDELGKELTNTVGESYSLYCARDVGPYAPGKGTPSGDWKWDNAWYNFAILKASIKQVVIIYSDGSNVSIEDAAQIASLFHN